MTAPALPAITEAEFQQQVIQFARLHSWHVAHFRPARTKTGWRTAVSADGAGWPDLFLVRDSEAMALELKSDTGTTTPAQREWLKRLAAAGIRAGVVRPKDWPEIERALTGAPPPPSATVPQPAGG